MGEEDVTAVVGRSSLRFGRGCWAHVDAEVRALGGGAIVVVTSVAGAARWQSIVSAVGGRAVTVSRDVLTPQVAAALADRLAAQALGAVVAVGGGTVIDAAKAAVGALMDRGLAPVPVVAVPTTAGTGSELTPFATVWDLEARRKLSVEHPALVPALAFVDPSLAASAPPQAAAAAAFDALCHAIESHLSVRSTPETRARSAWALGRLAPAIDALASGRADNAAWDALAAGSTAAGAAIASTRTSLAHALSYTLTIECGIAHGHACAMCIGAMVDYVDGVTDDDCADERGPTHVRGALREVAEAVGLVSASGLAAWVAVRRRALGLGGNAATAMSLDELATRTSSYDRAANLPRRVDHATMVRMLEREAALRG